ncbi:hypothetical protein SASPL_112234 [Salvia splendens]|uniref:Pectinesterase inhibitor domain-containing protein n=1 Tax=Salvia splendens TaxID=180675 RepID=A0A8X8Y8E1_SALSN|nr:hypothetical protein SASPL_112234 [Salvia splendens]
MAKTITFLALSLVALTLVQAQHPVSPRRARSRARAFIEAQSCHQQLAHTALAKAEITQAYITQVAQRLNRTKGPEIRSVMECLDQINDGVDQLTKSIKEAQDIKEDEENSEFSWHASNVQTWMSTALTDASMCIDGISGRTIGGKTNALIKARVLNLQQVTSIALALFNRFAARFRVVNP